MGVELGQLDGMVRALIAERDKLAERVRELEAERDRYVSAYSHEASVADHANADALSVQQERDAALDALRGLVEAFHAHQDGGWVMWDGWVDGPRARVTTVSEQSEAFQAQRNAWKRVLDRLKEHGK